MQNQIYKINLLNLSKASGLGYSPDMLNSVSELKTYLRADLKEKDQLLQNKENIKFVLHVANSITANYSNKNTFPLMQYFVNLFIEKHYDYNTEYNWQELKPLLVLVNYLKTATDFKSFEKQILNPHLHTLLLKYLSKEGLKQGELKFQ
jgi:hypothetical protein